MALPVTELPLFDVDVLSVDKKVKFRPFKVKEEKLLVLGSQSEDFKDLVKAIQQVITNCSFGKLSGDELPIFDLQNIFLKLRSASISPIFQVNLTCGFCGNVSLQDIDLDKVEIKTSEDHVNPVSINDDVSIEFNYPSAEDLATLASATEEAPIWEVAQRCIRSIHTTDDVFQAEDLSEEEKAEYIENLTVEEFNNVKEFFNTMPVMENHVSLKCEKCEETNTIYMNGYLDFFD